MAVRKKMNTSLNILLPIVLDDSFSIFKYSSFSRGYQVYKDRWQPPGVIVLCTVKKKKTASTTNMQLR